MKRDLQVFLLVAQVSKSGTGKKPAADPTQNNFPEHTWKKPRETRGCERQTPSCGWMLTA